MHEIVKENTPGDPERERILEELRAAAAEPLPPNRKHMGCGFLLLVPPLLMLGPRIGPNLGLPVAIVCAVAAIAGGYLTLFGGNKEMRTIQLHAATALRDLGEFNELTPDERRRAAVRAIYFARYAGGPISLDVYDPEIEGPKLGAALPYVVEVEKVLLAESKLQPVFTAEKS